MSVLEETSRIEIRPTVELARKQLPALTSLRFFAASMIVIEHWFEAFSKHDSNLALDQGVSCFFVLSGFILSYAYPKLDGIKDIGSFFIARIGRIWPAHVVATIAAICLLHISIHQPTTAKMPWITFANLTMVHGWILSEPSYFSFNMPSWSISTEFFFYLCFPFLIYRWDKTWKVKTTVAVMSVLLCMVITSAFISASQHIPIAIVLQRYLYINPLARGFEFVIGMLIFGIYREIIAKKTVLTNPRTATVFEAISIFIVAANVMLMPLIMQYCCGNPLKMSVIYWLRYSGSAPFYGILILMFAIGKGGVTRILSAPLFVKLGDISYSIYLFHWIILRQWTLYSLNVPTWINFCFYVATVLTVAYFNYTFIESFCRRKIVAIGQKCFDRKKGVANEL